MRISILGCGWLGMPLAKDLALKGHIVKGSATSDVKKTALNSGSITSYVLFWENGFVGDLISFLETDVLIITVPPSKVAGSGGLQGMMAILCPLLNKAAVSKVIFISSTSVYGDVTGDVSELTLIHPDTASAKDIVSAEEILRSNARIDATVIRFGGLVGPGRHPVYHLSGRDNVANADAAINLIHLDDCIGIIEAVVLQGKWGETINAAAPYHPSRKDYYTQKALSLGLIPPVFNTGASDSGKIILSSKVQELLNYTFTVTDTI